MEMPLLSLPLMVSPWKSMKLWICIIERQMADQKDFSCGDPGIIPIAIEEHIVVSSFWTIQSDPTCYNLAVQARLYRSNDCCGSFGVGIKFSCHTGLSQQY